MNKLKDRVRFFVPPAIWSALVSVKAAIANEKRGATIFHGHTPVQQELEVLVRRDVTTTRNVGTIEYVD